MSIQEREFIFARKKKGECAVIVDSPMEADFSSGEWLIRKIKEISGVEVGFRAPD